MDCNFFSCEALQSITPQPGPCGGFNPQQVGRGVEHGVGRYEAGTRKRVRVILPPLHPTQIEIQSTQK
eukprot:3803444-Amphidinium_carterae.1